MVNVALVAPAGTVTEDGTVATFGRLLPRLTAVPPVGAANESRTVPVADVPPVTLVGLDTGVAYLISAKGAAFIASLG